ncbi:DEAD/DEAH box helicase [Candidatus Reidiella endopervernicosa]|uniref:DEAD/DEAH box helicase n=1 Tax=Candidatus Reidiella endopervernicosa TaxID=2738883 RepID=A0A6N0I0T8_9GAMM|nr:DEAD/DEAH box helicase [Candidatus Reidiella endopervernicosa]
MPLFSNLPLNARLLKALKALDYQSATPVQLNAIPPALKAQDLLVSAETGSGKTAAFLLPTLHQLLANRARRAGVRALVLVPTRELGRQVYVQCQKLCEFTDLQTLLITGGDDYKEQVKQLEEGPAVVIATPGRLFDHLKKGTAKLNDLEVLILDEADRMLDMGFGDTVMSIAKRSRRERQTLLFSATIERGEVAAMARLLLDEPQIITLATSQDKHTNIEQQMVLADDVAHKERLLQRLLSNDEYGKALVFTNTRVQADRLGGLLRSSEIRTGVLHGDMDQEKRNLVMDMIRRGNVQVMVATDLAARGLDVKGIDLVINFEMARSGDDYVHRIGRTGRAGEKGVAISLIDHNEWNRTAGIERYLKQRFERREIEGLVATYKGPKKQKASGKAAGSKKQKLARKKSKVKKRLRDKKSVGKRRKPNK